MGCHLLTSLINDPVKTGLVKTGVGKTDNCD